jgi:hypothetical protein
MKETTTSPGFDSMTPCVCYHKAKAPYDMSVLSDVLKEDFKTT